MQYDNNNSLSGNNSTSRTTPTSRNEVKLISTSTLLEHEINVYGSAENPLFKAKDVAEWIDYAKTGNRIYDVSRMLGVVDEDEKLVRTMFVSGQNRQVWFLTEDGLYEVLMQSRKPIARQFKKGVKEILKSIRKHGAYMTSEIIERTLTDPDYLIRLATQLKEERQKRMEVEEKNRKLVEDNTHKAQVIEGLVYDIPVADMRQRINQMVNKECYGDFGGSWRMLYEEFDRKYHMNIRLRISNSGYKGSYMDYIDHELGMIAELYDLACKLFESSYEQLMESWGKYAKRAERYKSQA